MPQTVDKQRLIVNRSCPALYTLSRKKPEHRVKIRLGNFLQNFFCEVRVKSINEFLGALASMPSDKLQILVMLAALGLAAFAIYAVLFMAKRR